MLAVYKALLHWQNLVSGKVLVVTDNTTVMSYINKQEGTRSCLLARSATEMLAYFYCHGVVIQAKHIAGKLNVLNSFLNPTRNSRQRDFTMKPLLI